MKKRGILLALTGCLLASTCISNAFGVTFPKAAAEYGPGAKKAAAISWEGLQLTVNGKTVDLSEHAALADQILDAKQVGDWVVAEAHVNPHHSLYCLYNLDIGLVEKTIVGANLTWVGDDITTAVYSDFNSVYNFKDHIIGVTDGDEVDTVVLNESGTEAVVTDFTGHTFTFQVDQSDAPFYRFLDYSRKMTDASWNAFAATAPEGALALVVENPPSFASPYMPALNLVDQGATDRLYVIPVVDSVKVRLENVTFNPATGSFDPAGPAAEAEIVKGKGDAWLLTIPEGMPARCLFISAGDQAGYFPVTPITSATDQCSTFVTASMAAADVPGAGETQTAAAETQAAAAETQAAAAETQAATAETQAATATQAAAAETQAATATQAAGEFDAFDSYADLLFKYKEAQDHAYSQEQVEALGLSTELIQRGWPWSDRGDGVQYQFLDVNGDGANELIVTCFGSIIDIYSVSSGSLQYAYGSMYRSEAELYPDGMLCELFAPSMTNASTTWYRFDAKNGQYFPAVQMTYEVTTGDPANVHYYTFPYGTAPEETAESYFNGSGDRSWIWNHSGEITKEAYEAMCSSAQPVQLPEGAKLAEYKGL